MRRPRLLAIVAAGCAVLAFPGLADAASPRAQRSVAGVRATLRAYATDLLAGNAKAGCALLTGAAQKEIAKANHLSGCEKVIEIASQLLKSSPKQAAKVRSYASTVKITLHGDTATVPKLGEGGLSTLTYSHGLWYLAS
ncbi:MAG TPA: hypothetical protein VME22_18555 [Solirubrobacteraceae bacterium]|nr:hypothetical protein [Solirubrobacteraceae bacterium]